MRSRLIFAFSTLAFASSRSACAREISSGRDPVSSSFKSRFQGLQSAAGLLELGFVLVVFETDDDLAFLDFVAFVDTDPGDASEDFGRDLNFMRGDDVAGGVQDDIAASPCWLRRERRRGRSRLPSQRSACRRHSVRRRADEEQDSANDPAGGPAGRLGLGTLVCDRCVSF